MRQRDDCLGGGVRRLWRGVGARKNPGDGDENDADCKYELVVAGGVKDPV